jgi:pre-mRNA-processing factor 39
VRNVFDCFLAKFPLFFGYWKKYADLEFSIGGTETAEMVRTTAMPGTRLR